MFFLEKNCFLLVFWSQQGNQTNRVTGYPGKTYLHLYRDGTTVPTSIGDVHRYRYIGKKLDSDSDPDSYPDMIWIQMGLRIRIGKPDPDPGMPKLFCLKSSLLSWRLPPGVSMSFVGV